MKVSFLALAQQELDDAVAWYNKQATGLGQEFLDELAQELLDTSEVVAGLKQARGKGRPEGVTAVVFHHPGLADGFLMLYAILHLDGSY